MSITYGGDTIVDSSGGVLRPISSVMRNRIINGAMVIDQRNAGAATPNTVNGYTIDRWMLAQSVTGKVIAQQNAGSVTPPTGFTNYFGVTSQSAYSVLSSDYYVLQQIIEGSNVADLAWGTANAKTVTLSFQVYSSLNGTFGGALSNSAGTRCYPFSYTISSANTWTTVSVTIAGDTTGTWLTTNGSGIYVSFGLGCGSSYSGTANAWSAPASRSFQPTGTVSIVGTSGATFYLTAVQLEVGSSATGFEYRQYGQELALCQRYYETSYEPGTAVGAAASPSYTRWSNNGTANAVEKIYKVTKRAAATVSTYDTSGNAGKIRIFDGSTDPANITPTAVSGYATSMFVTYNASASGLQFNYTANAEL